MSDSTPIEWTNWTWNPLAAFLREDNILVLKKGEKKTIPDGTRGWFCTKCSPGCLNCYAEKINLRLGNGLTYTQGNLARIEWRLVNLLQPLSKRPKAGSNRVFVNSMTDLFHEAVPDHLIMVLLVVMALTPRLNFQVLTKRAKRMREFFDKYTFGDCLAELRAWECGHSVDTSKVWEKEIVPVMKELWSRALEQMGKLPAMWPLPNVWLGMSAEDQMRWNEQMTELVKTPAAVRFVSAEPLLGALDCSETFWHSGCNPHCGVHCSQDVDCPVEAAKLIDWLILGGESGARSRACSVDGLRAAMTQATAAGVAVMVKQLGKCPVENPEGTRLALKHSKGGDMDEWPADLRVRQFPSRKAQSNL